MATSLIIITTLVLIISSLIPVLLLNSRDETNARTNFTFLLFSGLLGNLLVFGGLLIIFDLEIASLTLLYITAANTVPSIVILRKGLELLKYEEFSTTAKTLDNVTGDYGNKT